MHRKGQITKGRKCGFTEKQHCANWALVENPFYNEKCKVMTLPHFTLRNVWILQMFCCWTDVAELLLLVDGENWSETATPKETDCAYNGSPFIGVPLTNTHCQLCSLSQSQNTWQQKEFLSLVSEPVAILPKGLYRNSTFSSATTATGVHLKCFIDSWQIWHEFFISRQ